MSCGKVCGIAAHVSLVVGVVDVDGGVGVVC